MQKYKKNVAKSTNLRNFAFYSERNNMKQLFNILTVALFCAINSNAEDNVQPKVSPTAYYLDADNTWQETTAITNGEAPLEVTFKANPTEMGSYTPSYEWHFKKQGQENDFMVRYEEETTYKFVESGTFDITLKATIKETGEQLDASAITVAISESRLEFPNAFSPNNDYKNDIYGAKGINDENSTQHWRSIVEFHGYIFNRWGQKLFEWTDVSKGWDGTFNGQPVKEGVYFLLVKAKGADGRVYNIRKDINLIRGYTESERSSSESE